jgi:acid phosphatase
VAIGDFGVGGQRQRLTGAAVERFAAGRPADALVTLGDNDYTERPAAFRANWLGSFAWAAADGLLVAGTLGNHDVRVQGGRYQFDLLGMPRRYYRRRVGDVGLFLIDSNTLGRVQLRWLESALASSDAPWKVVAMHHPAYSCGGYLGDSRVRTLLVPIFERTGVDLVLAAHDHNYQRFAPRRGVTYVVHGGGGAGLYPLRSCPTGFPARVRARAAHGWLYLRAEEGSLRVRAISRWGGVHDDFRLYP